MSIRDSNTQETAGASVGGGDPFTRANTGFNFHNGGFMSAMTDGKDSEYLNRLKKTADEILKNVDSPFNIVLLPVERKNHSDLIIDAMVVAVQDKRSKVSPVAYSTMLLEATFSGLEPRKEMIHGQPIEIDRFAADTMDAVMYEIVRSRVARHFGIDKPLFTDSIVIPTEINPDDRETINRLLANSANACSTEIQIQSPDHVGLNLASVDRNSRLHIDQTFARQQIIGIDGLPVRSDFVISFGSRLNDNKDNRGIVNNGNRNVNVSRLSGFIDFTYVDPEDLPRPQVPQGYAPPPPPSQRFIPRAIITDLVTGMYNEPTAVLLAVLSAATLNDPTAAAGAPWWTIFKPSSRDSNILDMTDIGALNYDANLEKSPTGYGGLINTKDQAFDTKALGDLMRSTVLPGLVISLDVPDAGPSSWYLSVFAAAARTNNGPAYDAIFKALNNLFNNNFEKHFPYGSRMFSDVDNRIHLGTWTDNRSTKRDLRDIDHLAVCALAGERNPRLIRDFSDTFLRVNEFSSAHRLQGRKKLIMGLTNETAEFKGMATRVTFSTQLIQAMLRAQQDTRVPVTINTTANASDFNDRRGSAGFVADALLNPTASFYQAVQGSVQGQAYYGQNGAYRW